MEDRRVVVRSFWSVIAGGCGCSVWLFLWFVGLAFPWAFGLLAMIACGLLVMANEGLVRRFYHAWNRRIARPLGKFATKIVLKLCLGIVFVVVGRAGSRFRFSDTASSSEWLAVQHAALPASERLRLQKRPRWIRSYVSWAVQSGNGWAVVLVPFLWLLRMFAVEQQQGTHANIYTLF